MILDTIEARILELLDLIENAETDEQLKEYDKELFELNEILKQREVVA